MNFNIQSHPKNRIAVIDGDDAYTYGALNHAVNEVVAMLAPRLPKRQYFIKATNSFESLVHYLAVLRAGHCAMLLSASIADKQLQSLLQAYQPHGVLSGRGLQLCNANETPIATNLALLLSTSGSSGVPKQVALSYSNLAANARSICQFLPIEDTHNALANLPLHYAYGLSVINTHLLVGATLVFTPYTPVNREFWTLLETLPIHSLAGVPHSYEMLIRLGLTQRALPDLAYLTQAGGKLNERWVKRMSDYCADNNKAFYVMYGQTEATARMSWLDPTIVANKPGAIGKAVLDGEFSLVGAENGDTITTPHQAGELLFRGPNVMLGYTNSSVDLAQFSSFEWLQTGDLAMFDEDDDYYIVGRLKRIIKVHGQRISLDASEIQLSQNLDAEVVCIGHDDRLFVLSNQVIPHTQKDIACLLHIHPSSVKIVAPAKLIFNENGKLDYSALQERYCG